jgi:hypothetical protein
MGKKKRSRKQKETDYLKYTGEFQTYEEQTVKNEKVSKIRIVLAVLLGLFLLYILFWVIMWIIAFTYEPSLEKHVNLMKEQIPNAIQFTETHQDGLDVLLRVQSRIIDFNDEQVLANTGERISSCTISRDYVRVDYYDSYPYETKASISAIPEGSRYDFVFHDEEQLIQAMFSLNTAAVQMFDVISIDIKADMITIFCIESNWATLSVDSPAQYKPEYNSDGYYRYVELIDENWQVTIMRSPQGPRTPDYLKAFFD